MNNLENLARKRFELYSAKTGYVNANWNYLDKERKLAWMAEVIEIYDLIIQDVKSKLKPVPPGQVGQASYERGVNDGMRAERFRLAEMLIETGKLIKEEYEFFKDRN